MPLKCSRITKENITFVATRRKAVVACQWAMAFMEKLREGTLADAIEKYVSSQTMTPSNLFIQQDYTCMYTCTYNLCLVSVAPCAGS